MTGRDSGRPTATTCTEIHGRNSGTRAIDLASRDGHRRAVGDAVGAHHRTGCPVLAGSPGWAALGCQADDPGLLAETAWPEGRNPLAFVCGPTSFVELAADGLVALGYQAGRVKTERFGGTGGAARLPPSRRAGRGSASGRPCKAGPAGRRLQGGLGRSAVSLRIPRDRTSPDAGGRSHEEEQARCR